MLSDFFRLLVPATEKAASGSSDVVVTMPVTMDVVGRGTQSFLVAVAVTWHFDSAEPLQDAVIEDCPKGHQCLFAWVPADRAGTDEFGIYIDDIGAGETLQNGMVAEVIEQAQIEPIAGTRRNRRRERRKV